MSRFRAAPYVKALFEVAGSGSAADRMTDSLDQVAEILRLVPELQRTMVSPLVPPEVKQKILDQVLQALEIDGPVRRFIFVVQSHFRLEHMSDIAAGFRSMVDRSLGRVHARVEVASVLDETGRRALIDALEKVLATDVVADFIETPELLGGFRLQVGSKLFDGSLAGQLKQLGRGAL
ncbi:MAG: ATP synthase F1 subunit delta [Acidobacteria bacterium]|nr:ATP synthase F1 subunit delta [Acidobacteriota bacterium]